MKARISFVHQLSKIWKFQQSTECVLIWIQGEKKEEAKLEKDLHFSIITSVNTPIFATNKRASNTPIEKYKYPK